MILWECVKRYESMLSNGKRFKKHYKQVIIDRYIVLKFLVIFYCFENVIYYFFFLSKIQFVYAIL